MLLRYGKHINYLATAFILVTFFGSYFPQHGFITQLLLHSHY